MNRMKRVRSYVVPILTLMFFLFGFLFAPNDPAATNIRSKFLGGCAEHPFGTDNLGRCELSRILEGGKTTLGIVMAGSAIVVVLGIFFGILLANTTGGLPHHLHRDLGQQHSYHAGRPDRLSRAPDDQTGQDPR